MTVAAPEPSRGARRRNRPKGPGTATLAMTVVLALLVAILGIASRTAPPPTVAQFAPQAVKQIKQAPKDQSSRFGTGNGNGHDGKGPGGSSPAPSGPNSPPPTAPPRNAAQFNCVGDPPRQIEDSQSPPCIAFWQGNNGGSTYKGVTGSTINVAVPKYGDEVPAMQNFFNEHFQFYGRKLHLFNPNVSNSGDPTVQRNDAASVDSRNVFASLGYSYNYYYMNELARRGVISVTAEPFFTEKQLASKAPYEWQYPMGLDGQFAHAGAWICQKLAGKKAADSGSYQNTKRVLGIVGYQVYPEVPIQLGPLTSRLDACGAKPAVIDTSGNIGNGTSPDESQAIIAKLKSKGVTSVVCTCDFAQLIELFRLATGQDYFPEWIVGTFGWNDQDFAIHQYNHDPAQVAHMVGVTVIPRELRPEDTPATWAVEQGSGQPDSATAETSSAMWARRLTYHELLLLASGIQMAGPNLTPQTFQSGLQRTKFPDPILPSHQGNVDFLGDHTMTDDAAEIYWDEGATSPYADAAGQGAFCYTNHGMRFTVDSWPKGDFPPTPRLPCDSRDQ